MRICQDKNGLQRSFQGNELDIRMSIGTMVPLNQSFQVFVISLS